MSDPRRGEAVVIGHRGASAYRPENTRAAYALAVEQGADMLEVDLHLTRDEQIVISHDAGLGHLGLEAEIGELTLAEVRALDAGEGERVPTLAEVLDEFAPLLPINLEIKVGGGGRYPGIEALALAAVRERELQGQTLFSSFYDPVLATLREASAEARIAVLVSRYSQGDPLERAEAVGAEAINPDRRLVSQAMVHQATAAGLAVYVYTVDSEDEMDRLLDWGVRGLFTNVPDRMRALVDRRRESDPLGA